MRKKLETTLTKETSMTESRLKKSLNAGGRNDRASEDASRAAPETKFVSSQERRKMWSDEWNQSALPKVPEMPGWHLIWLSTTNAYDTIDKRVRLGYIPVKADENCPWMSTKTLWRNCTSKLPKKRRTKSVFSLRTFKVSVTVAASRWYGWKAKVWVGLTNLNLIVPPFLRANF